MVLFFQAEDGIRGLVRSRGFGDGYKRQDMRESSAGENMQGGVQSGLGVQAAATYRISEQGFMKATDNPLDL